MVDDRRSPEALLEDDAWVRRLARQMLSDEHLAEDLAQDAWLAAVRVGPRSPRAWLRRVVRNLGVTRLRREARRAQRERRVARPEREPAVDALVERAELQRRVADAILSLDPRYRDVVLLRFFDGLAPRDIARRTGEPAATVRSRLSRALDLLRVRLDADYGTRERWLLPLAALAWPRRTGGLGGGALVSSKAALALISALLLLAVGTLVAVRATPRRTVDRADRGPRSLAAARPEPPPSLPPDPLDPPPRQVAIEGVVIGRAEAGVPGAHVIALPGARGTPGRWLDDLLLVSDAREPVAATTSGEGGVFTLSVPAGRDIALLAWAEGVGATQQRGLDLREGGRGIVLRLEYGGSLRGRVIDARGRGVPGARLSLWRERAAPWPDVASGPDGSFEIAGAPVGPGCLVVRHPELSDVVVPDVTVPDDDVVVLLPAGGVLEGRVLRIEDRAPVAGARVWLSSNLVVWGPLPRATTTDAAGRFRFEGAPTRGAFSIVVDGGAAGRAVAQALDWDSRWKIEEVLLGPTRTVRGRVVLSGVPGEPGVEGVRVRVHDDPSSSGAPQRGAVSDADGRFVIDGVSLYPSSILLAPDEERYVIARGDVHSYHPRDWDAVTVRVVEMPLVRGRVVGPDGRPLAGVRVGTGWNDAVAGTEGTFRLRAADLERIRATHPGYTFARAERGGDELVFEGLAEPVVTDRQLRGVVVGEAGEPIGGASVLALTVQRFPNNNIVRRQYAAGRTWGDGTFVLDDLPDIDLTLSVGRPGFLPVEIAGVRPRTELSPVVLRRAYVLRGTVVDRDDGPVVAMEVTAAPAGSGSGSRSRRNTYTDDRGAFELGGLQSGTWEVSAAGGAATVQMPGSGAAVLRARVPERLVRIEGIVIDADGRPVPAAGVQARPLDGGDKRWVQAGLGGRFAVAVAPGRYRLEAAWGFYEHGSRQAAMVFAPLEVDAPCEGVEIRAHFGKTIEGRVEGPSGADLSRIPVEARIDVEGAPRSGASMSGTTDADGRFVLVGLQEASYTVSARTSRWLVDPVPGVAAGTQGVRLIAREALSISGRVLGNGELPEGLRIDVWSQEERPGGGAVVREDGTFTCGGLEPGSYTVRLTAVSPRLALERTVDAGTSDVTFDLRTR